MNDATETLRALYLTQYLPLKLRGKSDSTKRQYLIQIDHFCRFLGREATLDDLDDEVVTAFLGSVIERGNSPATANKARNHILSLWRYAARKKLVPHFPDVARLKEPRRKPVAWHTPQIDRLLAECSLEQGRVAGVPKGLWWTCLHLILFFTGERISALLQLRLDDLDWDTGWLTARAETRKFATEDKSWKLRPEVMTQLKLMQLPHRELLFPWDRDRTLLYRDYGRILIRAELPHDRKSKFHRMRKTHASYIKAAGGDATEALGHSSPQVTAVYLDPTITAPEQAADLLVLPAMLRGDGRQS